MKNIYHKMMLPPLLLLSGYGVISHGAFFQNVALFIKAKMPFDILVSSDRRIFFPHVWVFKMSFEWIFFLATLPWRLDLCSVQDMGLWTVSVIISVDLYSSSRSLVCWLVCWLPRGRSFSLACWHDKGTSWSTFQMEEEWAVYSCVRNVLDDAFHPL